MKKVLDHIGGRDVEEMKGDFAYVGHHTFCVLLRKRDHVYCHRDRGILTCNVVGRGHLLVGSMPF